MTTSSKVASNANASWQESLSIISEALIADDYSLVCTITSRTLGIGAASTHTKENSETTPLPNNVRKTLQQIYCRALIHLSKYEGVLEYCTALQSTNQQERFSLALEEAYSIYKLGRYLKCRDFILKKQKQQQQDVDVEYDEGLMHILAQCHYRLHETNEASLIYTELLRRKHDINNAIRTDRDNETMTNAIAVKVANFSSPTSLSTEIPPSSQTTTDLEEIGSIIETMFQKGQVYPYELSYNYATHLLLASSSISQVKKAMELLIDAERTSQGNYGDTEDNDEDNDERQKQENEIQRNIMPIQANLALGKLLCSDWNGATRAYLQLVLSSKQQQKGVGAMTHGGGGPIMVAENNLAVIYSKRGTSCSVFDLLKKVHNIANSGSDSAGLSKTTPNQVRTLLYNRALLFYKMNKFSDCNIVLDHLTKALSTNGQHQYHQQQKANAKKKKGKKNKKGDRTGNDGDSSKDVDSKQQPTSSCNSNGAVPLSASPANDADSILWECRIALLKSEIIRLNQSGNTHGDDADTIMREIIEKVSGQIKAASGGNGSMNQKATLEYALAELTLHKLGKMIAKSMVKPTDGNKSSISEELQKKIISVLNALPTSIRSRPATIATLSAFYGNLGMDDKVANILDSTSGSGMAQKNLADFKLRLGSYEEAASLYESTILAVKNGKMSLSQSDVLECKAGMVKALSYYDIEKAVELASKLPLKVGKTDGRNYESELDGEELEGMDIPRLSKASGIINNRRSSQMRKDIQKKKKKNHDAILRQRAKKREFYLEKLEKEGRYNPDRPTKPDPERWIPKNQRSYAKRGRKARQKFVGAQGGGTGAGAEKDAARLDAMARAAARAEGKDAFTQQPSTAHLSVSSTNVYGGKNTRRR